jgi:ubiquinone/menaquinone biosynthesis C-methylase UbiE
MTRLFGSEAEFKAWNDEMVEKFDVERFHDHPSPLVRYVEGKRIRRTLALLAPRTDDRVLEVGCGAGHLLARLSSGRGFGLDLSDQLLRKAERRIGRRGVLVQGNAETLPFRPHVWDRIYCSEVLEHLASPRAALIEIQRALVPGGITVVSVPNERLINRLKRLLEASGLARLLLRTGPRDYAMPERMDDEWHLHTFDRPTLLGMMPAGLHVTRVEPIPFPWLPLRYVVRCEAEEAGR